MKTTSKRGSSSATSRRGTGRRTLVKPQGDSRYVRRSTKGQFKESDDMGRSQRTDRRRRVATKVRSGYGDRGDR